MAEVYVKSNFPVKTTIYYAGEVRNADGTVLVTVYDISEDPALSPPISPSTVIYQGNATQLETDYGTYQFVLPLSITVMPRKLKLVWSYQVNSESVSYISYVDIVTPYCDISDLAQDLNLGLDPSDPNYKSYHELIMAEKYARKVIESYTGQNFYLYDDVQIAYGVDSDILPLPYKLSSLHELYANDILLVDTIHNVNQWSFDPIISETGFGIRVDRSASLDNTVYIANGMVPPTINDSTFGAFKKGVRYKIAGRFGWESVPDNVQQACIQLMGDYFAKDKVWTNKYVKSISTFDWDFEYSSDVYKGTGNAYADQLLYPYVLNNMVVI
jgi:hypothetical protein